MNNKILVLNSELSGINKSIIFYLRKREWDLIIIDVPNFLTCKILALISSFSPNIIRWRNNASKKLDKLYKTAWISLKRTEFCKQKINALKDKIDLVFQISGMFMPTDDFSKMNMPYVIYTNYTIKLTEKYPPWEPFQSQKGKWYELEKKLYNNARLIFTGSENTKKSFQNDYGVRGNNVVTVGCGLTNEIIPYQDKSYNSKTVLFVGLDFERKGGYILLEAFKRVRKEVPNAKLVIIGPAKAKLNINEANVIMLGRVNDKSQLSNFYEEASIFVMPSLCEPFGLVFLEAMSHKLPCIGTTVDAIPEIIDDGKTGFLVPARDFENLAKKIISLLKDPKLMQEMGAAGYLRLKEKFTWDRVIDKIDFHLKAILN